MTTKTYVEGPTVTTCLNAATCNQLASVNGPRTDVTDLTSYTYNADGTLQRIVGSAVSGGSPQTDLCYDPHPAPYGPIPLLRSEVEKVSAGNVSSVDGPRTDVSDVTSYTFDTMRRLTRIQAPLGALARYCYDADGQLRSTHRARTSGATDPNAGTAGTTGLCSADYPSAQWQSETRTYWPTGDLETVSDAAGGLTRYAYDAVGRQTLLTESGQLI